ncbi:hypothetical protein DITRI_Ditri20bG0011000 [Diplodiscus trichospermus]
MGFFLIQRLFLFLLISQSFASETISHETKKRSAYDVLRDFNFPIGLLPKGVLDYDLDSSSGKFSAFLNGSCSFSLEGSYQLRYKNTIKGYISRGKLSSLEGVSVKLFFMWVNIVEVSRRGDELEFSVGIAGAGFPVDNFEECPQCGCGLDCNNHQQINGMDCAYFGPWNSRSTFPVQLLHALLYRKATQIANLTSKASCVKCGHISIFSRHHVVYNVIEGTQLRSGFNQNNSSAFAPTILHNSAEIRVQPK